MILNEQTTKLIPLGQLELNEGQVLGLPANPRKWSDDGLGKLRESLEKDPEFLQFKPLLVYPYQTDEGERFCVIGGNMRLAVCRVIGYKALPCMVLPEDTSAEKLQALVLKDNASYGEWAWDMLADWDENLLADCDLLLPDTIDLGTNADADSTDNEEEPQEIADTYNEEEDTTPDIPVALGDVWELGAHRLICGDSTDRQTLAQLMRGEVADLVFTDPPYGMKKEADGVLNDNLNQDDLLEFNKAWVPISWENLKDNGSWYCWGTYEPLMDIYSELVKPAAKRGEVTFRNMLNWFKGCGQGARLEGKKSYSTASEQCLFIMKGQAVMSQGQFDTMEYFFEGYAPIRDYLLDELEKSGMTKDEVVQLTSTSATHYFSKSQWMLPTEEAYNKIREACAVEGGKEYKAFRKEYEAVRKEYEAVRKEYEARLPYFDNTHDTLFDTWEYRTNAFGEVRDGYLEERKEAGGHATHKPLFICERGIKTSSRPGEVVLDMFGGSGSTLIACEHLGRSCRIVELSPHYCSVIIKRWERATGCKAKKM